MWYPVADSAQGLTSAGDDARASSMEVDPTAIPSADELTDWAQHFFAVDAALAGKLGFGVGSVTASGSSKVVIAEFSRSKGVKTADGKSALRYGVALRLVIKVSNIEGSAALNLPMIAAETQLGRAQTEAHLVVNGYAGEQLAKLIPPWKEFSVESYVELMQSIARIQELIASDVDNIRPTLLQVYETATDDVDDEHEAAVGTVWALTRLLDGDSCVQARRAFPIQSSAPGLAAIDELYADLTGRPCDDRLPTNDERDQARRTLGRTQRSLAERIFG